MQVESNELYMQNLRDFMIVVIEGWQQVIKAGCPWHDQCLLSDCCLRVLVFLAARQAGSAHQELSL